MTGLTASLFAFIFAACLAVAGPTPHKWEMPAVWSRLSVCESGGNPADTQGGYEGMFQFLNSTWLADGGARYAQHAYDATPRQQLRVARVALRSGGVSQWPQCAPRVGLQVGD